MAQPCTDAKGRELKLGDRRWIIAQNQPYELLFVDARDDVMRLLALPLEGMEGEVPEGEHLVPFGRARIARPGSDVTVVTWSKTVHTACEAMPVLIMCASNRSSQFARISRMTWRNSVSCSTVGTQNRV